jgi:hypothetical protein
LRASLGFGFGFLLGGFEGTPEDRANLLLYDSVIFTRGLFELPVKVAWQRNNNPAVLHGARIAGLLVANKGS